MSLESERDSRSVVSDSLQPHGLYVAHQAPLSMGFCRQEYWSGLPFPSPGDLPDPRIKPTLLTDSLLSEPQESLNPCLSMSSVLAGGFFTTSTTWEAWLNKTVAG